jgi:uncharacterized membrane protein YphA (DoxX/SURF4 family)
MSIPKDRAAVFVLQWTLGLTVLVEAAFLAFAPAQIHAFTHLGLPDWLRLVVAWGEIVGAILFLVPRTVLAGSWWLMVLFLGAAAIHFLHRHGDIGALLIYAAAALVVMTQQKGRSQPQ